MKLFEAKKKKSGDFSKDHFREKDYFYNRIASMGNFYSLTTVFDEQEFNRELTGEKLKWVEYNKNKTWSNRFGLSLFSLKGETSGEIDLNSVLEWNRSNNTNYTEMSFRQPTPHWKHFNSISTKLQDLQNHLGRSHLLKLDEGGIFPPHRDSYKETDFTFRLIAFFNCLPSSLHLNLEGKNLSFQTNRLYFLNTRLVHSVVSFQPEALMLILNVELNPYTVQYVVNNLAET